MTTKPAPTIDFEVRNRWSGEVQFAAQIECSEDTPFRLKLGLAVKWALKTGANLSWADLSVADLSGADLSVADLSGANLSVADLSGADLSGANLSGADLSRANLSWVDLSVANLSVAKWRDGVLVKQQPVQIGGLTWPVTILDTHMQIGCELHSHDEWAGFDNERIATMDGTASRRFWRDHRDWLLGLCAWHAAKTADKASESDEAA